MKDIEGRLSAHVYTNLTISPKRARESHAVRNFHSCLLDHWSMSGSNGILRAFVYEAFAESRWKGCMNIHLFSCNIFGNLRICNIDRSAFVCSMEPHSGRYQIRESDWPSHPCLSAD